MAREGGGAEAEAKAEAEVTIYYVNYGRFLRHFHDVIKLRNAHSIIVHFSSLG